MTGTIADGEQLPLPAGYTADECYFIVSPNDTNPLNRKGDINEGGTYYYEKILCFADSTGKVTVKFYWQVHGGVNITPGNANYTVIGLKSVS